MSAGGQAPNVQRDLSKLAPKFHKIVSAALAECEEAGLDAYVYESVRSKELQELYYKRGRTVRPPMKPVTNAKSNLWSWHGFALAVDVISRKHGWNPPDGWWDEVADVFKLHGCKWGGDWKARDLPHFQFGACKPSPSDKARELYAAGGLVAVWHAVGAD